MQLLLDDIYKVYRDPGSAGWGYSYFVKRRTGNIFLPRMARTATINNEIPAIEAAGGIARIYVTDYHFAGKGLPPVAAHFDAPIYCSEVERPKLAGRGTKDVQTFPYTAHVLEKDWHVIPTPAIPVVASAICGRTPSADFSSRAIFSIGVGPPGSPATSNSPPYAIPWIAYAL
jgi:hypothetical protein